MTLWALLVAALAAAPASAGAGRTGAPLMLQTFGARPYALGEAYSALGDDLYGLSYNPAILGRLVLTEVSAQFDTLALDSRAGYLGMATPLNPRQALGLGAAYLDGGKADVFDDNGVNIANVDAQRDLLVTLAYARNFSLRNGRLHLGVGGKALRSSLFEEVEGTALAMDAGALYERAWLGGLASAAGVMANVGPGIRYTGGTASGSQSDPLPMTYRAALGYSLPAGQGDRWSIGLQGDRVAYDETFSAGAGIEYVFRRLLAVRLGYRTGEDKGRLTVGVGAALGRVSLDYGIGLVQDFSNSHQLTMTYRFEVPGIRYGEPYGGERPLDLMIGRVNGRIQARRFFEAEEERRRIDAVFGRTSESLRLKEEIRVKIEALANGVHAGRREYAFAFAAFYQGSWEEAVASLELALRSDPESPELHRTLRQANLRAAERERQATLEREATTGRLFALAHEAFTRGAAERAERIADEILRVYPYQPAFELKVRIAAARRVADQASRAAPPPKVQPSPRETRTEHNPIRAEELYNDAIRQYAEASRSLSRADAMGRLENALKQLQSGARLDPESEYIKRTLELVNNELKQRRSAP